MPIHEKSLIAPSDLLTADRLVLDGVDVSGHWNTMLRPRYLTDYDPDFYRTIQAYGAPNVHRCWQCGSCTNACTVYALDTDFNPRYWIYLVNLGLKGELLKDKDLIWRCVSCHKCTHICPKDVRPEEVMKALQHWLEDEGHVPRSSATLFDEEFTRQCLERGRIEDSSVVLRFLRRTGEDVAALLRRGWLGIMIARAAKLTLLAQGRILEFLARVPLAGPLKMLRLMLLKPRTRSWSRTGAVLREYLAEQERARAAARAHAAADGGAGR